ncbi:MAG: helix-turn-helix domain-containing protein [Sulfitobacter sp.]|jgi:TetR/AcrR family transcriptional repressor of nem operon
MSRATPYDRDKTLDAAMSLFWDKGYHATSLKDLEVALAMKPGSIYAAFKSKENLYLLALERYFTNSRDFFRRKAEQAETPLQFLADHLRGFALLASGDAARQACMLTKTMVDTRSTDVTLAEQSRQYLLAMRTEIANVFEAAKTCGELFENADPNRLARRYQANLTALRLELHQGIDQSELNELAEDMAREVEAIRR